MTTQKTDIDNVVALHESYRTIIICPCGSDEFKLDKDTGPFCTRCMERPPLNVPPYIPNGHDVA